MRLDSTIAVDYHVDTGQSTPNIGNTVTKNISAGGVRIVLKEKLSMNSIVNLTITLPDDQKAIKIVGQVAWQQNNTEGTIDTGIKYIQIDPKDIQRITDYVLRCLSRRLTETQQKIAVSKKAMMFLYKEIRVPGDKSQEIKAPDFLIDEVNIPGDKVRYAKISSSIALRYKIISGNKKEEGASFSQYVSGRGVWFLTDKEIHVGESLEIRIDLPDSGIPVIAVGTVSSAKLQTRLDDQKESTYYEIGLQFKNISITDRKRVIRYVYNCKTDYMMIGRVPPPGWLRLD